MSIRDRLARAWRELQTPVNFSLMKTSAIERPEAWQSEEARPYSYAGGLDFYSQYGAQQDVYRTYQWVQIAIRTVASIAATAKFSVKRVRGEKLVDIPNHPFERLLAKPNPLMSRFELIEATAAYYALTGNSLWWMNNAGGNLKTPTEIWTIPPANLLPVPDEKLYLRNYRYRGDLGTELDIPLEQVAHFKRFNPSNRFVGLSPIEALYVDLQSDRNSGVWQNKIYGENNGRFPGILAFSDNMPPDQRDKIKAQMMQSSMNRMYMLLFGTGQGGVSLLQNNISQVDRQYIETRRWTMEEVNDVFAPGLSSILSINATEANAKTGKATLIDFAVWPMLCMMAEKITNDILPMYGDGLVGEFDDIRIGDRAIDLVEQQEYSKTHTIDEIREKYYQDKPLELVGVLLPVQVTAQTAAPPLVDQPIGQPTESVTVPDPQDEEYPDDAPQDIPPEMLAEMGAWERKSLKAVKAGKPANVSFETRVIELSIADDVRVKLAGAKSADDVHRVFIGARVTVNPIMVLAQELRLAREALTYAA